jgi:hypothetical protein
VWASRRKRLRLGESKTRRCEAGSRAGDEAAKAANAKAANAEAAETAAVKAFCYKRF